MANLKIGIVGCGHVFKAHLRAWRAAPGCELPVACDKDRRLADPSHRLFTMRDRAVRDGDRGVHHRDRRVHVARSRR